MNGYDHLTTVLLASFSLLCVVIIIECLGAAWRRWRRSR